MTKRDIKMRYIITYHSYPSCADPFVPEGTFMGIVEKYDHEDVMEYFRGRGWEYQVLLIVEATPKVLKRRKKNGKCHL